MFKEGRLFYKGFIGSVETPDSPEENNPPFFGSLQGIKDSINYYGFSLEELKSTYKNAVDNYIDLKKEINNGSHVNLKDIHVDVVEYIRAMSDDEIMADIKNAEKTFRKENE